MNKMKKVTLIIVAITFASLLMTAASASVAPLPPTATHASSYSIYVNGSPAPDSGIPLNTVCTVVWTGVLPVNKGTFNIIIYDPDDNVVATYYDQPMAQSGHITFLATQPGYWTVEFDGATTKLVKDGVYAYPSVFVLPESVIGGLSAIGAGFAAFGLIVIKRKK
jgi:hypothetical protein